MTRPPITYVFDPFCGWCYGASPLIGALAAEGYPLTLMHRVLFSGDNIHPHSGPFPSYAAQYDRMIAQRCGVTFSQSYSDAVLGDSTQILSTFTTALAKQAVARLAPERVLEFIGTIQHARFIDGLDATQPAVLIRCAGALGLRPERVLQLMMDDPSIWQAALAEKAEATRLADTFGSGGVPLLLMERNGAQMRIDHGPFLGQPAALIAALAAA